MAPGQTPDEAAEDLLRLAKEHPGELSEAEAKLLRAAPRGEWAVCGPSGDLDDATNDPAKADDWGPERQVRARVIRWLCVDPAAASRVDPIGIRLLGARITGTLNLCFANVPFPLMLFRCRLAEQILLMSTQIPALYLNGSRTGAIGAHGLSVEGNLFLRDGFTAEGEVCLVGVQIRGDLDCSDGVFQNPPQKDVPESGKALWADRMNVKGSVLLHEGFTAEGEVRLLGTRIGGNLGCSGGTFRNLPQKDFPGSGTALLAEGVNVSGGVYLRDKFNAEGEVRLARAQIGTDLDCSGGKFMNSAQPGLSESGTALRFDGARVSGSVVLRKVFTAEGEVRLPGAQIGGNLDCSGGTFRNPPQARVPLSGDALSADGAVIKGDVFLRDEFIAKGEVRLAGAQIGGDLDCAGGTFKNPPQEDVDGSGEALSADGANVKGNVFLRDRFIAEGEVRLPGARIGGNLECRGGEFKNPPKRDVAGSGKALSADRVNVEGGVLLSDGFAAEGEVGLSGAQIGSDLSCWGGTFSELIVQGAKIAGHLLLARVRGDAKGKIDLTNASADALLDDEVSWPAAGNLRVDGFVYGRISVGPTDAETRLKWLALQPEFKPQPYSQLAKVLREAGHARGARRVLYEMERRRREAEDRSVFSRLISWAFKTTLGYGYYPQRGAVVGLVFLIAMGWCFFRQGYFAGAVVPTDKGAYYWFRDHGRPPDHYQRFTAFIYSFENSVPLFNLGQKDLWTPDPSPRGSRRWSDFLRGFRWGQIVLGWLLSTLFVAGVTGVVRRE
ncbi:MAG: hypothetical protein ABSF14_01265 [Terriglobia bacterium]|jgi:hypothetical protein